MKTRDNHYVNNNEFYQAMVDYKKSVVYAEENDLPKPKIPDYIGEAIYKIATRLSYKPNFVNYSYKDEMISDGLENCINYIDNFDPEKSTNPFAYFTQIIYYAFLRRIQKEKKQVYIKHKISVDQMIQTMVESPDSFSGDVMNEAANEFVKEFEHKASEKRSNIVKKKRGLEIFLED